MTNFSGTWNAIISSPLGKMAVVFAIVDDQGAISGSASNDSETVEMREAVAEGDRLTWVQSVTKPMRLTLKFDVTVEGDELVGTAKAGVLPASKLSGTRTSVEVPQA